MLMKFFNVFVLSCILVLRPFFGRAQCRFTVTCTQFAAKELEEKQLFPAIWSIMKRVLSCGPFL